MPRGLVREVFITFLLMIQIGVASFIAPSVSAEDVATNPLGGKTWFRPYLVENNDKACSGLLAETERHFLSREPWYRIEFESPLSNMEELHFANGRPVFISGRGNNGCGGACETYWFTASEKPIDEYDDQTRQRIRNISPPGGSTNSVIRRENNVYLASTGVNDHKNQILVHKVNPDYSWSLACRIGLAPPALEDDKDADIRAALKALQAVEAATNRMRQEAGSCGSMNTHYRWKQRTHDTLPIMLSRPWSLAENPNADSVGAYAEDMAGLEKWSLTGIEERKALAAYRTTFAEAEKALSSFYEKRFGWSPELSLTMATAALKGVISGGMNFYAYRPTDENEPELKRLILDGAPIADIQVALAKVRSPGLVDLSLAINHPEALEYLLKSGINPDQKNDFGKTPLMYAAQYNRIESARLLLQHGADPNATTTWPYDSCQYTLSTSHVTPLHYAVRYASPELVKLLVDSGAETFIKTVSREGRPPETPLDWFHRYTAVGAPEVNPNISQEKFAELERILRVPSDDELKQYGLKLILQGEQDYKSGDLRKAYRKFRTATDIHPDNERALNDLALAALRLDELEVSLEAGYKVITAGKDSGAVANAWFNQGVACEKIQATRRLSEVSYNGGRYCDFGIVYPYYQSLVSADSVARRAKITELYRGNVIDNCTTPRDESVKVHLRYHQNPATKRYDHSQYLYVLHPAGRQVELENFSWDTVVSRAPKHIVPVLLETKDLGEWSMSILKADAMALTEKFESNGFVCRKGSARFTPKS